MKPELIEKFFRKECLPKEAKKVALYLKANPQVLKKYLSADEWEQGKKVYMPEEFWNEAWENIQQKNKRKAFIISFKKVAAVAASVIILISTTWFFYPSKKPAVMPVTTAQLQPKKEKKFITNTTNKVLNIVLEDSSEINLSPASTVQYEIPFPENKREIFLDGEGTFHIAKNKQKPFTVYAGSFATTALGTIFSVKKDAGKNIINVKLFQGKVVIHAIDKINGWNDDVYLLAGEQLKFNAEINLLAINKIINTNNLNASLIAKPKKVVTDSSVLQLNFSNVLLSEVFQKLSATYHTSILYDSAVTAGIKFTGVILKTDSLSVILNAISQMNNLDIIKTDDGFTISKHSQ